MNTSFFLSFLFIVFLSLNSVKSQQELCADINDNSKLCTSFSQNGCLLDLQITLNQQPLFNQNVTLLELSTLNGQTLCPQTNYDCELCFSWEGTAIQSEGSAQGCLTLSGGCLDDPIYLGCFNDDNVNLCSKPSCPGDCSGNGICEQTGECNCNEYFYGDDCSNVCESSTFALPRLESTSTHTARVGSDFLGFIKEDHELGFLGLSISVLDKSVVDLYVSKSCHPDSTNHQFAVTDVSSSKFGSGLTLEKDCQDIDGGVWFVFVQCKIPQYGQNNCRFSITVRDETVQIIDQDKTVTINSPSSYYQFTTQSMGYTISLTTTQKLDLTVSLMQSVCPTTSVYLSQLTKPSNTFYSGGTTIYKYTFASKNAAPGTYFLLVTDRDFYWGSKPISKAFTISATNGYCYPSACQFGKCTSHGDCQCYPGFTGHSCDTSIVHHQSPSSAHHHDSSSSDKHHHSSSSDKHHHSSDSSDHHHRGDDDLSGWAIGGIIFASFALFVFVIFVIIVILAIGAKYRKSRVPADNIYNLLTTEEPL